MIYVYREPASDGAVALAVLLGGKRLRKTEVTPTNRDVMVNWGKPYPRLNGARVLNGAPLRSKAHDIQTLTTAGIRTVEMSTTRPAPRQRTPFQAGNLELPHSIRSVDGDRVINDIRQFLVAEQNRLREWEAQPVIQDEWVGRMNDHVGGNDLLHPPTRPDYWVKKLDIEEEYRLHMFGGKSIRAGRKEHREGFTNPNSWIRSHEGGWWINYGGFKSTKQMREIAAGAVAALGLDFGAVDIGKVRGSDTLVVFEVNRAPGLEGNTLRVYGDAIQEWIDAPADTNRAAA